MSYFVFRNNTVERFFPKDYSFSGYDDISFIPDDATNFIWFYQAPIKFNQALAQSEINSYADKLLYILENVGSRNVIALTMDAIYSVPFTEDAVEVSKAIVDYNKALYNASAKYSNLKVLDITEFTRNYSATELIDWKFYFISQMGLNPKLAKPFQNWILKKIDSVALKRKKCIVLDLDNTLWGGVLGEDGIDGIKIGGDYPGKAFLYFQEALLELSRAGVILSVCSKNNEADVIEVWEKNPYIVLKKDAFSAYRINWNDKASNIRELAEELNIGLDSFVFVDDNPTERELVKQMLPMVAVPDFPEQPYELPQFFKSLVYDYFKVYALTAEDKKKSEQYKANALRTQEQRKFSDLGSFLKSLQIHLIVEKANDHNIARIAQMTQKTNQFNLTTKRYSDADIKGFVDKGAEVYCLSVADKFGDNGITGCIIVENGCIDTFLLSCRVLGKGIEQVFLKSVLGILKNTGLKEVCASYLPSLKNAQVSEFYDKAGFTCLGKKEDGSKDYRLNLDEADLTVSEIYNMEKR